MGGLLETGEAQGRNKTRQRPQSADGQRGPCFLWRCPLPSVTSERLPLPWQLTLGHTGRCQGRLLTDGELEMNRAVPRAHLHRKGTRASARAVCRRGRPEGHAGARGRVLVTQKPSCSTNRKRPLTVPFRPPVSRESLAGSCGASPRGPAAGLGCCWAPPGAGMAGEAEGPARRLKLLSHHLPRARSRPPRLIFWAEFVPGPRAGTGRGGGILWPPNPRASASRRPAAPPLPGRVTLTRFISPTELQCLRL